MHAVVKKYMTVLVRVFWSAAIENRCVVSRDNEDKKSRSTPYSTQVDLMRLCGHSRLIDHNSKEAKTSNIQPAYNWHTAY
jgi:hypothetical protein